MYALRQPSSFEFGKYGAVVFPSHEDAFNYELLNSLGDHEAQLRRVCEPHVRQALIAVTVGNRVIPPHIMIHGEHHVLAFIEEFIEEIGTMKWHSSADCRWYQASVDAGGSGGGGGCGGGCGGGGGDGPRCRFDGGDGASGAAADGEAEEELHSASSALHSDFSSSSHNSS